MLKVSRATIIAYMAPMLAVIALINVFPILYTLYISFTSKSNFHPCPPPASDNCTDPYKFVGLGNYSKLLGSITSDFYYVMGLTILYVIICVVLFLVVGLATGMALNNTQIKGLPFWRAMMVLPWAVPSAVTALIWKFLFHFDFGPFNQMLRLAFGSQAGVPWLTVPVWAFAATVIVNLWLSFPPWSVIVLGALQSIPQELYEAASVDGANAWQRFRAITLPLLRPAITPFTILSAITTFQMFNTVYLLLDLPGGPYTSALKPGATEFVMLYVYINVLGTQTANRQFGLMGAFAILIFILLLVATILALRATNLTKEAQA